MTKLAIVTPTYRPDFENFRDLHASVRRHAPSDVLHYAIVPRADIELFASLNSPQLVVRQSGEFLPRWFFSASAASAFCRNIPTFGNSLLKRVKSAGRGEVFINYRRPWPPIRGWILQQLIKFSFVGSVDADVVLLADSDVAFIRSLDPSQFVRDGAVRFYRLPASVTAELPRHMNWHERARRLLGLSEELSGPCPDYVTSFVAWDPRIVRRIQQRIASISGSDWQSVLAAEIDASEWTIYGTYVDQLGDEQDRSFSSSATLCHSYWDTTPLTESGIQGFIASLGPADVAVLIQSKSHTSQHVRRHVISEAERRMK